MPAVSLGDKKSMLSFTASQSSINKNLNLEFTLLYNKTCISIQHTAYLITMSNDNQRLVAEIVLCPCGHKLSDFVLSAIEPFYINANLDTL